MCCGREGGRSHAAARSRGVSADDATARVTMLGSNRWRRRTDRRSWSAIWAAMRPAPGDQHDAGRRLQQRAGIDGHQVGAQRMDRAVREFVAGARPRSTAAHGRLDRDLQVLHVGRSALVDDDQIDREPLHAPVLVGAQQLADLGDVLDVVDPQQHDRQVAGDRMRPQSGLRPRAAKNRVRRRPETRRSA